MFLPREPELVLLDIQSVPAGQEGWLAFDVTSASNRWLLHPRSNLGIRLYVETEEGGSGARPGFMLKSAHKWCPMWCTVPESIHPGDCSL